MRPTALIAAALVCTLTACQPAPQYLNSNVTASKGVSHRNGERGRARA